MSTGPFPQLEVAKDPERMCQVFQTSLLPRDGHAFRVSGCRVLFARYRSASRCLLQYVVRLEEVGAAGGRDQIVTGVIYGGERTQRVWKRLERAGAGRAGAAATAPLAPFAYVPDLDMLLQVVPFDHRLPAIADVMTGPPAELEPLVLARFGSGEWRAEAWDVKPVRYRVDSRAALRATVAAREVATGRVERQRFYAKVYRDQEFGAHAYRALRDLSDATASGDTGFGVGRPVAYLKDLRILVQEGAPGTALNILLRREGKAIPAVRRSARALAALHRTKVTPPRLRPLRDDLTRLERAADLIRSHRPDLRDAIDETVGAVVARLDEVSPAPTHCDLKPGHVLIAGDLVVFLDFDRFAGADPVLDVANLLLHLVKAPRHVPASQDVPRAAARAFAEEYFAHAPEPWSARLPPHYAMAVLTKAAGLYRGRDQAWADRAEYYLREAQDALAGRLW